MTYTKEQLEEMLSSATPGPWMISGVRVKIDRQSTHAIIRYNETTKRDENICNVWYDEKTGLGIADARLIANAPALAAEVERLRGVNADLLAACEALLRFAENTESELGIVLGSANSARAAIAKARGLA